MSRDTGAAVWTTSFRGETVELPATIEGIRAALPAERREAFDAEVSSAPGQDLHLLLAHWALETRPDIRDADEAIFTRLDAGDFSGFTAAEDLAE